MSTSRAPDAQLFHDAFNASPIGIAVENLDGQPLFVNPAFCAFLGFTEEELRSKHCVDFSPSEDAEKDWALFQQLKAGSIDHYQLDKRYFRKDGSLVWGRLSISLLNGRPSPLVIAIIEDITDKKSREELLATFVKNVPAGVAMLDCNMHYLQVSDRWCSDYGVQASAILGRSHYEVFPDIPERWKEVHRRVLGGETVRCSEDYWDRSDGRTWVRWELRPWTTATGGIGGIIIFAEEITHRKRAEEAVHTSEERLRLAQQAAHIGTFERDMRTGRVTCTPELESMYGLPPGRFEGTTFDFFENLIHPGDRQKVIDLSERAFKTEQPMQGEWRVIWPDGTVRWISGQWQVHRDDSGQPSRVLGVNMDVTDGKLAEQALQASEEKFRSVFQDAGVGMVIVSPLGQFMAANGTFCDYLGYTEDELLKKTVESITLAEDWPAFSRNLSRTLRGESTLLRFEKRCLHKSGRIVYTQSSASVIRNREGDPQYLVGEVLDITKSKEAERAVAEMTRKLIEAQEQERRRIGRELHDDINQRLALVSVELSQLQQNPSGTQSRIKEIQRELDETSSDLEALSRDLHPSKIEYLGAIAGIKSWCKESAARYGIEIDFKTDLSTSLPFEVGLSLFRVVQEAVHNSVKHSGVKHIEIQLRSEGDEIHLNIGDVGKGFEVKAAMHGKGLGLTSMKERVRLINGTISIDSKPLHGTTIHVRVPLMSEHDLGRAAG